MPPRRYRWCVRELLAAHPDDPSQAELARRAGVPVQTVNRMCAEDVARHPQRVDLATIDGLADALGVGRGDLWER